MEPSSAYRNSVTRRNEFFAKLKPVCVEISKAVMRQETISSATKQELIRLTDQLYGILTTQTAYDASVLDSKLAEYVFFPLSFIFRKKEQCPARLVENAVKVVRVLIQYGWKSSISKELSQQLLILLTFLVGGVPGQPRSRDSPEETALEGFRALTALMRAAGSVSPTSSPLTDINLVPAMGHTITVILDGINDGETTDIRLEALDTIQALFTSVKDLEALASFFPGTVSSLATVLSPPESLKTQRRVLIRTLQVLKTILVNVMGDMATRDIQKKAKDNVKDTKPEKMLTPAWLEATAAQVKLALSTVLKLRKHGSFEVRRAVEVFTVTLLDECHSSLANCTSILVESAIIAGGETFIDTSKSTHGLASIDPKANLEELARITNLEDLATIYPELGEVVKTTVYDWITSLPRSLQSSDEDVKKQAIQNLMKGNKLIRDLHLDSSMIEGSLATTLRDSVVTLVRNSKESKVVGDVDFDDSFSGNRSLVKSHSEEPEFLPVIMAQDVQSSTRQELATFIASIGTPAQQAMLASEMLAYVQYAEGIEQISAYWLAFQLLKSSYSKTSDVDSFLDLSMLTNASDNQELVFNELYTFSVSTLSAHSDTVDVDWRLEAVALEITAFASSRMGASFRPELIDVLYPVSTLLGSPTPQLRRHAITTLNIIAASCGYDNVSAMIIDNADYMVNSISLRLNTLDISPASTKVLTMMIRLTGPSLIPYLDDVIAAIFAALDNYHGYPAFVSSLFAVLGEVVEQGAKSDVLLLESKDRVVSHRKRALEATRTEDIVDMLAGRTEKRRKQRDEVDVEEIVRGHSQQPWKSEAETMLDQMENPEQEQGEQSSGKEVDKAEVPKTPTYQILSRIVMLTQHYLTSPTPTLRKSLLDLLKTVAPALAPDENAFLPLINSVWPVLVSRLYDSESYVAIAACGALAALCEAAGDFLASRIKTEWWDRLGKWCKKSKRDAAQHGKGRGVAGGRNPPTERGRLAGAAVGLLESNAGDILIPTRSDSGDLGVQLSSTSPASSLAAGSTTGLGRFAQAAQIWEAAVQLLTAIVSFVRLDDEIFDEILDLLADTLARNDAAREALEVVNADAVWLALYRRGEAQLPAQPHLEGAGFADFEPATNLVR